MELLIILVLLAAVGYFVGFWSWLAMAASFVVGQPDESRNVRLLRWKLGILKVLAGQIGETEDRLRKYEEQRWK
jgi:hypothetical protein